MQLKDREVESFLAGIDTDQYLFFLLRFDLSVSDAETSPQACHGRSRATWPGERKTGELPLLASPSEGEESAGCIV